MMYFWIHDFRVELGPLFLRSCGMIVHDWQWSPMGVLPGTVRYRARWTKNRRIAAARR